jgi:signal transduction histidine kinase
LEKAIRSHIEHFRAVHPALQIKLDLMPDRQTLPEQMRLALFRIYQEMLNNVIRHAQAQQVVIRFTLDAEEVILEAQDDGRGFEVPQRWIKFARGGHLGLVNMSERAEAIGGQLKIISAPGRGTTIRVVIPLPEPVVADQQEEAR